MQHTTNNYSSAVIVDCGKNQATILNQNDEVITVHHQNLMDSLLNFSQGTLIVSEQAHLGVPRKGLSKAQPFTEDQLLPFYKKLDKKGITLRLFPQQQTPRALSYYRKKHNLTEKDFVKSDHNDLFAIRELLVDFPNISLAKPFKNFEPDPVRVESQKMIKSINSHLNFARTDDDAYNDEEDKCRQWIDENIEMFAESLSEDALDCFGFNESKHKRSKELRGKINTKSANFKMTQFYTIISCLLDYHGNLRLRNSTNKLMGLYFFKKYIVRMSAFHFKGGVVRSNLYHHGTKNYINKVFSRYECSMKGNQRSQMDKNQDNLFLKHRKIYNKAIIEVFQIAKKILESGFTLKTKKKQLKLNLD
jgi:hypothetical protein